MSDPEQELQRIGDDYRQKFPAKLDEILTAFESIDAVSWSRENLALLMRKLHALRGSAGTIGFSKIAEAAAKIEQDLALISAKPTGPSPWVWLQIGENIRSLSSPELLEYRKDRPVITPTQNPRSDEASPLIDLVEDDDEEAEFVARILSYAGFRVRRFSAGEEYIRNWSLEGFIKPDAIIMDMVLQSDDFGGVETIAAIEPDSVHTPVIFLSQRGDMQARLKALEAGATRYLVKPVDTAHLANLLDALSGRQPEEPYRVLLVDDEPELLEVGAEALRTAGMTVLPLGNPMETLNALASFKPDVLILDVYMQEVTGPEIAAVIRDSDEYLNLPILFLSSEQSISQQLMALNLGGDDFLVKPLQYDHLVAAVNARARRSRQNLTVVRRVTSLSEQLVNLSQTFDEHCIRIALDRQFKIVGVNTRFEQLMHLTPRDVESNDFESLQLFSCERDELREILKMTATNGSWRGRMVLNAPSEKLEIETTICTLDMPESSEGGQYWLLGTVV